jgi:hypothetical protein
MLVRKFIGRRLAGYYASLPIPIVGSTSTSSSSSSSSAVDLGRLLGEWLARRVYKTALSGAEGLVDTVELFAVLFNTLANFVATAVGTTTNDDTPKTALTKSGSSSSQFPVWAGCGRAGWRQRTNAKLILDHLKEAHLLSINESITSSWIRLLPLLQLRKLYWQASRRRGSIRK